MSQDRHQGTEPNLLSFILIIDMLREGQVIVSPGHVAMLNIKQQQTTAQSNIKQ